MDPSQSRLRHLHDLLGPLASEASLNPRLEHLRSKGELVTCEDACLLEESQGYFLRNGQWVVPAWLRRFITEFLRSREPVSLLDPFAYDGIIAGSIAARLNRRCDVICESEHSSGVSGLLHQPPLRAIAVTSEQPVTISGSYDAIVTVPGYWGHQYTRDYQRGNARVRVKDEEAVLVIPDYEPNLARSGVMVVVLPIRYLMRSQASGVMPQLSKFGLYVTAMLGVEAFEVVIVERVDREGIYAAEVPVDSHAQDELIARMRKREEGPAVTTGRIVSPKEYRGRLPFEAQERVASMARAQGLIQMPFGAVVKQLNRKGVPRGERFAHDSNAVYLPEMARTPATTDQDYLPEKLQSYFQLVVDPALASPEYIAMWLNSPIGHAYRDAYRSGYTIPRLSPSLLETSSVFLPPLRDQLEALKVLQRSGTIRAELAELESRVWMKPRQVSRLWAELSKINREDRFDNWLGTLPFPLASILRLYHAGAGGEKEKIDHLLHFFEAATAFHANALLSACRSSPALWQDLHPKLLAALGTGISFELATFGCWRNVFDYLAAQARKEQDTRAWGEALRAVGSTAEVLYERAVAQAAGVVNGIRNDKAHGGCQTPAEVSAALTKLEKALDDYRRAVGDRFDRYSLFRLGKCEVQSESLFSYEASRLMGSDPQFVSDTLVLRRAIPKGSLLLCSQGADDAVVLLPFIQMRSGSVESCYFYNRLQEGKTRLVCYHRGADKSELKEEQPQVSQLVADLMQSPRPGE